MYDKLTRAISRWHTPTTEELKEREELRQKKMNKLAMKIEQKRIQKNLDHVTKLVQGEEMKVKKVGVIRSMINTILFVKWYRKWLYHEI